MAFCFLLPLVGFSAATDEPGHRRFDVPADSAEKALKLFSEQAGRALLVSTEVVRGVRTNPIKGELTPRAALEQMLAGTGLVAVQDESNGAFVVKKEAADPNAPRADAATPAFRPSPSAADTAKDTVVQLEQFVTTGSRFNNRTVTESPVPIDVIPSRELKAGGYTGTAEMLVAAVPSFNFPRTSSNDGLDIVRPATLRGLSPDQTLVLVNGKRRHTGAVTNINNAIGRGSVAVDLNAIPAAALGRVEVLRDGAAAQYGSDAIAGVINLVLDKSLGSGFDVSYGGYRQGDGRTIDSNAYAGVPLGEKGVLRTTVFYRDRDFTNRAEPDTRQQYFGTNPATGAATAISANFGSGTGLTPSSGTLDPREATINRNLWRRGDPEVRDAGVFLNAELPLANGLTLYGFGGFSDRRGLSTGFFRRAGQNETVRALFPNGYLPVEHIKVTDASVDGGIKGSTAGWQWDLSSIYGSSDFRIDMTNSNNVSLGNASPTAFKLGGSVFSQSTTNLDLQRPFSIGLAEPVKVAFGLEHRRDQYKLKAGEPDSYRDGGVRVLDGPSAGSLATPGAQAFPGFRPSDAVSISRDNNAAYLEVEAKPAPRLLVTAAARYEDYSDFGSSSTYKLSGRLALADGFALRASVGTGFHAPHLAQSYFSSTATFFVNGLPVDNRLFPVSSPEARLLGATPLKPETSRNLSLGATYEAGPLAATVDYYRTTLDDRIVLSPNFGGGAVIAFLAGAGFPGVGSVSYFTNAVDTMSDGVDLTGRYVVKTMAVGKFTATLAATTTTTSYRRISPVPAALATLGVTSPLFDLTQRVRLQSSQPKDKIVLSLGWDFGKFSFLLRGVRYGEYETVAFTSLTPTQIAVVTSGFETRLAPTEPASANSAVIQIFKADIVTDLDLTYRLTSKSSVSVGASNLFDIYPTRNLASTAASVAAGTNGSDNAGTFVYTNISPYGINGAFLYAKFGLKF